MRIIGNYGDEGFAHIEQLISPHIARAFMQALKADIGNDPILLSNVESHPNLLMRPAFEIYGNYYKPMIFFLWGLTPIMEMIVGRPLLPTYDYFRIYREGDVCRVHSDRFACEHSLSLTLDYSDGEPWALQIGRDRVDPSSRVDDTFESEQFASIEMKVGDAVLYQGVSHRHGRVSPNPNAWSAHLFLHWVERNGPYSEHAFDGVGDHTPVNFTFA